MTKEIDVLIPVYQPEESFWDLINQLKKQTVIPRHIYLLQTVEQEGDPLINTEDSLISVYPILKQDFDHGATRAYGAELSQAEFMLFMTQDALPKDAYLLERLLEAMEEEKTAIAYARQLPRENAGILEVLARRHNYPGEDRRQTKADLSVMGIKTYFCSDVCAMYRRSVYFEQGGFVHPTIFNEDMIMASRVIQAGYQVAYCSKAQVIHSHSYTCRQQFSRNFDLGVSQRQYREVFEGISSEKEGAGFAKRSIVFLLKKGKAATAFYFALQCAFKLAGYRLGLCYDRLPRKMVLVCTMNKRYWDN